MRTLIQLLWPTKSRVPGQPPDPHAYLRPLIVLAIVMACGPEIFAAADLIALLDLLGVMLFLTAFNAGFMTLSLTVVDRIKRIFLPVEWTALIARRSHPSIVTHGLVLVGTNALATLMYLLIASVGTVQMVKLLV